jgi:hypothetical protein
MRSGLWPGPFSMASATLLAVKGEGDAEHDGDEAGELGAGEVVIVQIEEAGDCPGDAADQPYPCSAAHRLLQTRERAA